MALTEHAPMDDNDLLSRCRSGDIHAWRALYHQHLPLVYRLSRRLGVSDSDFPDVCQEVFLRVHRGLGRFRGDAQFPTWLYRIVLHEVARHGRLRSMGIAFLALLQPLWPAAARDPFAATDASADLQRLLDRMKPKQRRVFVLHELEELSPEQIAAVVGCPLETVRSRLRHARAAFSRLRRQQILTSRQGGDQR